VNTVLLGRAYDDLVLLVKKSLNMTVTLLFLYCSFFDVSMLWIYIIIRVGLDPDEA